MGSAVEEYVEKQGSPQREICAKLRKIILKTLPTAEEEMKWGVPAYAGGKCYFVALKTHVNLGFSIKGLSKEGRALLEGGGKTMKHIEIASLKDMDEKKIVKLLKELKI
ncbi:DUF1801 domain-containing protein [Candidatus Micrarchaeota archaeon]|nr:DUF1801 domain-containing protein [Candidatus Micrarchaeota archaeon]